MDKWALMHMYRRAFQSNEVPRPVCRCGNWLWIGIGAEDDPILECWSCDADPIVPGVQFWATIKEQLGVQQ